MEQGADTQFIHLLTNGLTPTKQHPQPEAAYVICGNYRVEHITVDTEQLIEATGQRPEDALKRVRILVTSSADQQANPTVELEHFIKTSRGPRLVLVKGI